MIGDKVKRYFSILCKQVIYACICFINVNSLQASFYQSQTLANYCADYIKYSRLDGSAGSLEAGICSGYVAATIELMDLSGRLCQREHLNLDNIVDQLIKKVEIDKAAAENSASYVLVEILQREHACE